MSVALRMFAIEKIHTEYSAVPTVSVRLDGVHTSVRVSPRTRLQFTSIIIRRDKLVASRPACPEFGVDGGDETAPTEDGLLAEYSDRRHLIAVRGTATLVSLCSLTRNVLRVLHAVRVRMTRDDGNAAGRRESLDGRLRRGGQRPMSARWPWS